MPQVMVEIPDLLVDLPIEERDRLIRGGVYEATQTRIRRLEKEILESKQQIQLFETKYGVSFSQFETGILPETDTIQVHQDYNDWYFWQTVLEKNEKLLSELGKARLD